MEYLIGFVLGGLFNLIVFTISGWCIHKWEFYQRIDLQDMDTKAIFGSELHHKCKKCGKVKVQKVIPNGQGFPYAN